MYVGAQIRRIREQKSIGQRELARRMKMDPGALARIESGQTASPRFDTMIRFAMVLGVALDAFVCQEEALEKAA